MERLTKKDVSVQGVYKTCCVNFRNHECEILEGNCTRCSTNDKVWDRLAEYEDTELSPEECKILSHHTFADYIQWKEDRIEKEKLLKEIDELKT